MDCLKNHISPVAKRRITGVGFDIGDTLICNEGVPLNWASLYPKALAEVAAACGVRLSAEDAAGAEAILKEFNTRLNPRTREVSSDIIFKRILKLWGVCEEGDLSAVTQAFFRYFQQSQIPYADSAPVLAELTRRGIPVGALTDVPYGMSSSLVRDDLAKAEILEFFRLVLTSVDVGWRKPDVTGYRQLAKMLGLSPGEMLYVGNEEKDVVGARKAGFISVLLVRDGSPREYGQDFTCITLLDLLPLVTD
jgi:putative hydrolase of the HAD superfamily